jgi:polyphosphate kinase
MLEVNKVFNYLENPTDKFDFLKSCKSLMISPTSMRKEILSLINREIKHASEKKKAYIILKLNSLSDEELVNKLYDAAKAGVEVKIIVRGICCMYTENKKFILPMQAISIVDEYLEHSRVMVFYNNGQEKLYISSADYMIRNLNHRIEVACPITDKKIKTELLDLLNIQLKDTVKARILNNDQDNQYIEIKNKKKISVNLLDRQIQETLEKEYQTSLEKLLPLKQQLSATDELIDLIVYKLYGLSEEEIKIIEGRE